MKKILFIWLVTLIIAVGNIYAQVVVDSLETLPDQTIIVKIGGKTYRGLQAPQMREILKTAQDLKISEAALTETNRLFNDYKLLMKNKLEAIGKDHAVDIKALELKVNFWQGEYNKEVTLRKKYEGIVDGCSGKIIFFRVCI